MPDPRRRMPTALTLVIGLALGWSMANHRPAAVMALGGDRYGDYTLTSGPISLQYNEQNKTQASQDALYFLDYRGARLLATIPAQKQSSAGSQWIEGFIERDLASDFKLDLERGPNPHFLMSPGSVGASGDGMSPLFVFETTTKQVAVYRVQIQSVGTKSSSRFDLLQLKSYAGQPAESP